MKTLTPPVRHVIIGQWILTLTCLIATVTMYTSFYRLSECQSNYMTKQYDAQHARVEIADAERDSLAHVFEVTTATTDRNKLREAWFDHAALLERNNKLRAENPFPALPRSC